MRSKAEVLEATLNTYRWPSEAFWRVFEVELLSSIKLEHPVLEIGCGNGTFTTWVADYIDYGIDLNLRGVERCRAIPGEFYRKAECMDARDLPENSEKFATVYANCVMEHIPDLDGVLQGCFRSLRPEGSFVATVPLRKMNDHLTFRSPRYAEIRQRQLEHLNLLTDEQWQEKLQAVGFSQVEFRYYLTEDECRFWDGMDAIACVGMGRYKVGNIAGFAAEKLTPTFIKTAAKRRLAKTLLNRISAEPAKKENGCAAAVIARKAK